MNSRADVVVLKDIDALSRFIIGKWAELSGRAVEEKGFFSVALSGGDAPQPFYRALARHGEDLQWEGIHIFMVDERHVPFDHPDRNYGLITKNLVRRVPLPAENAHPVPFRETAEFSAEEYEREIRRFFGLSGAGLPSFDLVMLGVGPDGHTASLFPGHQALEEKDRLACAVRYVGATHDRVTLTFPVINNAGSIFILETGRNKAGVMKSIIEGAAPEMPGAMVKPARGEMIYLLDDGAASLLG